MLTYRNLFFTCLRLYLELLFEDVSVLFYSHGYSHPNYAFLMRCVRAIGFEFGREKRRDTLSVGR